MNVIIVGTSSTILEKKNGHVIDEFDYVARSVSSAPYTGYEEYTGTKTNLYWSKFQFLYRLRFLKTPFNGTLFLLNPDPDNFYEGYVPQNAISTRYKRLMFDLWVKEFIKVHKVTSIVYQDTTHISLLHKYAGFRQQSGFQTLQPVYSSAGLRVIQYFIDQNKFDKIYVTGFSFFDKGTYFDIANNHIVHEHCYYKEKIYYKRLIAKGLIHEL
jgi:hypothetical protein